MVTRWNSRMLLQEAFTGLIELESYVKHFDFIVEKQNWEKKKEI